MYYVIGRAGHRREQDISWPSSPIGTVSCTACVLSHRTGEADERKQRKRRRSGEEERRGRKVSEENLTTTTLMVRNNDCFKAPASPGKGSLF